MAVESWSVLFSYIACVFFFIQFSKSFLRLKNNSFKFPVARLLSFSSLVHDFDALISYFSLTISATGRERRWKCCTRTKPTRTVRIQRQRKWGVKIQSVNCDEWRATERTNERENRVSERAICWVKRCERAIPWHAARRLRQVSSLPLLPFIKNVDMVNFQQTKAKCLMFRVMPHIE